MMDTLKSNIYEKVKSILNDDFNIEINELNSNTELELSSIDKISFILKIEDEFNVSYKFEKPLDTIQDIIDFIIDYDMES